MNAPQLMPAAAARVAAIAARQGKPGLKLRLAVDGGVLTQFSDGSATFSPDGLALGGGGATVVAYAGRESIAALRGVEGGVQTLFGNGEVYFSADGRNLGGGGNTVLLPAWSKVATSSAFVPGRATAIGIGSSPATNFASKSAGTA